MIASFVRKSRLLLGLLGLSLLAAPARSTWSIVVVDTETGELAVAGATCIAKLQLKDLIAVVYDGVGVAAAQASGDSSGANRQLIFDGFMQGLSPDQILQLLASSDPGHYSRQYGIVTLQHDPLTYSGSGCGAAAAGVARIAGNLRYAIQGNVLTGSRVVVAAEKALLDTPGDLTQKVMAAMEAARSFGGDGRCSCSFGNPTKCGAPPPSFTKSAHISFFVMSRPGDQLGVCNGTAGCANGSYFLDLNYNGGFYTPDPVLSLERMYKVWRADQAGRPDQVQSQLTQQFTQLHSQGGSSGRVELELADLEGAPVTNTALTFWFTYVGTGTPVTTPGAVKHLGGNRWAFSVQAGTTAGTDRWQVWVDDGVRPVLLQPDVVVEVLP
jgi:uncharacterized Ntn-hydrolase superfamily protein